MLNRKDNPQCFHPLFDYGQLVHVIGHPGIWFMTYVVVTEWHSRCARLLSMEDNTILLAHPEDVKLLFHA